MQTTILVNYDAGWGNRLTLRGSEPLDWESGVAMEPVEAYRWKLTLDLERPLEFKPCINDKLWAFGRKNYLVEPGETKEIFPHFGKRPGSTDILGYIPYKGRDVTVRLYIPPGYKENPQQRHPVCYCTDGRSLFESKLTTNGAGDWHLEDYLDTLIEARLIDPLLVVGVDFVGREGAPETSADEFAQFMLFLKETIDRNYLTLSGPDSCGLLGSEESGLFALWLGQFYPRVFTKVAALSPNFHNNQAASSQKSDDLDAHRSQKVYLDRFSSQTALPPWLPNDWVPGENFRHETHAIGTSSPGGLPRRLTAMLSYLFPWSGNS